MMKLNKLNLMRKRNAQAAMEFLMTYGWALLVVLVVIGALWYMGVLNPESNVPDQCNLGSGFTCAGAATYNDGRFGFTTNQNIANIRIKEISVKPANPEQGFVSSKICNLKGTITGCTITVDGIAPTPNTNGIFVPLNGRIRVEMSGVIATNAPIGTKVRLLVTIKYTDLNSGFDSVANGDVVATVTQI